MKDIIQADVPKDLSKIKTKIFFNLTKRQLLCFGGGALIGVPLYFLTRSILPKSLSLLLMIFTMTPFFLLAMYEKNGQPLEVVARHVMDTRFRHVKKRPYKTNNLYAALERQAALNQEVKAIVRPVQTNLRTKKAKGNGKAAQDETNAGGKKATERGADQGQKAK